MLIAEFSRRGEEIEIENELWQYDYGQKIQIKGLDLPEVFEVHYSWKDLEKTKVVTGSTVDGVSVVDIPNLALEQRRMVTAYIYLSDTTEGETVNTIILPVNRRKAPEDFETPEDIDLFHYTLAAIAEYQRRAKESQEQAAAQALDAESWAHGREDHPEQVQDNAKYYSEQAAKSTAEVAGKTEQAKKDIDKYVQEKEADLKGDTGNVFFAAFKVVNGRLKMYSDPTVDKVCFKREGSRLKYRLKI